MIDCWLAQNVPENNRYDADHLIFKYAGFFLILYNRMLAAIIPQSVENRCNH